MERHQYSSLLLPVFLSLASLSAQAQPDRLEIIQSSDQEFHFVFRTGPYLESLRPEFKADSSVSYYQTIQVAVPADASARLVSAEGGSVVPWPEGVSVVGRLASRPLVELGRPVIVRGRKLVSVRVNPVVAGGRYTEIEIRIAFDRRRSALALTTAADTQFDRVLSAVIANYDVARTWPVIDRRRPEQASLTAEAEELLTAADQWYKVRTDRTGLYRLTGAQLAAAGIGLTGLYSDSVRLFNAGGVPLAVENDVPRPEFAEVALMVLDGGDGLINSQDQIIFFAEAVDRRTYRFDSPPAYVNNRYTNENVYWLAVSGDFDSSSVRMGQIDGSPTGPAAPLVDSYWNRVHVEQDNLISKESDGHIWDYYNWFWTDDTAMTVYVATPGALGADSAFVHVDARTNRDVDLRINGVSAVPIGCGSTQCQFYTYSLTGGAGQLNRFDFRLEPINATIPPYFNFVEVVYRGSMAPAGNQLDVYLNGVDGVFDLQLVDQFSAAPTIFDLSNPQRPVVVAGYVRGGGTIEFRAALATTEVNRFYVEPVGQARAPLSIGAVEFTDLRTPAGQADLLLVTPRALEPAVGEYLAYREAQGRAIEVVAVEDIMDNFSYGLYDPTAIRDFLRFAYESYPAPAPSGVLFVGDANYDFLDHLGTGVANLVPSYIRPVDRSYSDDNYVYFGDFGILDSDGDRGYDMMTARWPVRAAAEIENIVAKIRGYESPSNFGSWRTRVTLVADDEHTNERHDETFHTTQTEELEREHLPRYLNRQKIYLWDYPFVNREKPAVNDAIVSAFNAGAVVVNYVGHGNPDVWSHEQVFQRGADLPRLHNFDRLPLVFAASCDIGFFDDPRREGMAEDLLELATGGAIGVVSATRLVYAADNAQFNQVVYDNLFGRPDLSICEAVFAAKLQRQYSSPDDTIPTRVDNDRAYTFFGDPLIKLGVPGLRVEFTDAPDSLIALGVTRLRGQVVDAQGAPYSGDGTLFLTVYDSDRRRVYRIETDTTAIVYYMPGPSIYRGTASITAGSVDVQFITPVDVTYRGTSARISAYGALAHAEAVGLVDSIRVADAVAQVTDSVGPQIEYAIVGRDRFVSGDVVSRGDLLSIRLADPSGINLVGGIGHGITLVVDDEVEKAVNLSGLFEYDRDDYTAGGLIYAPADDIPEGRHRLKVKAWDNANNVATSEFEIEMVLDRRLAINELLNYPNPMGDLTTFYFQLTQPVEQLSLEIFTLSGKNIWSRRHYGLAADYYPNSRVSVVWDGRDADGDRVATGVYIYKATAVPQSEGETVEEFGKIVVVN